MNIVQVAETFAARVTGVDLTKPLDSGAVAEIESALDRFGVLVFPNQPLSPQQQVKFAESLGPLELSGDGFDPDNHNQEAVDGKISQISNLGKNDERLGTLSLPRMYALAARLWHTDSTFREYRARYTMLSCKAIPAEGGETQLADVIASYAELPESLKAEIKDLVAEHTLLHTMKALGIFEQPGGFFEYNLPLIRRPIVHYHPGAKKQALCVPCHASGIVGMTIPDARMLLADLRELITQPRYCYTHRWSVDDFIIWDDRSTLHRGRPYDDQKYDRKLNRSVVRDTGIEAKGEVVGAE